MANRAASDQLKATVGRALGRVPSGLFIVTTRHEGRPMAMLVSWLQQAAFDPPAVSFAVNKDRPLGPAIRASGQLAVALLAEGDTALVKKYARGIPPGQDPFDGIEVLQTPGGLHVPAAALAYLDCRFVDAFDFGADHEVFLATVEGGSVLREGPPYVHIRGNGFNY